MSKANPYPLLMVRTAGLPFDRIGAPPADWPALESAIRHAEQRCREAETALLASLDAALSALPPGDLRTATYNARKDFFQRKRLPVELLVQQAEHATKAPLARVLRALESARQTLQTARDTYSKVYEQTLTDAYRRLQTVAAEPEFQRALLFAGHDLLGQLPRFVEKPPQQFAKKERQTALAVLQYATRMATRTTPLSRFATVFLHPLDGETLSEDEPLPDFGKTAVSPNVALLEALYTILLREPVFYQTLQLILNPCIVEKTGEQYRWLYFDGQTESFQETPATPLLDHLVESFLENNRRKPYREVLAHLAERVDAAPNALENWLHDLTDTGFLEWELPEMGLSPDWAGRLYRFLGFIPAEPVVVDTAALLQTLRTTARSLSFLPVDEAMSAQHAAADQVREYFERWAVDGKPPIMPPEQLFYEDVERPANVHIPNAVFHDLLGQLAAAWQRRPKKPLPTRRAALAAFFSKKSHEGKPVGFLQFVREFLEDARRGPTPSPSPRGEGGLPSVPGGDPGMGKQEVSPCSVDPLPRDVAPLPPGGGVGGGAGALFQVFQENGRWHAVINAMFPGGGKLFARWHHLFPERANSQRPMANGPAFPWQGYFNANFQPTVSADTLAVPGGRVRAGAGGREFLLGDLEVATGPDGLVLCDRATGQPIVLTDLGLEAPETRPPAMQVLWLLGVPYVSVEALLPDGDSWREIFPGIQHRERYRVGVLVLARAAWQVAPEQWLDWLRAGGTGAVFFGHIRAMLAGIGVPRHVFAHFSGRQAQHFDLDNPLSVLLLHKLLRQGSGVLHLAEMLPVPEEQAREFAGEWGCPERQ